MYYDNTNKIICLDDDIMRNYFQVLHTDKILTELYEDAESGKGKNSSVFLATDPNNEEPEYVVKFCNYHDHLTTRAAEKKRMRFEREIRSLREALDHKKADFLLSIVDHGTERIGDYSFMYYVMEKADGDLSQFLEVEKLTIQQKVILCDGLLQALKALHSLGIYHRDLKPDNIFFKGNQWKIGDLGFIAFRDDDFDLDGRTERVGPAGLMSPEATNKHRAIRDNPEFIIDCSIDNMSDIFQLGNLFWFIFQGDVPTGQVFIDDFRVGDEEIFSNILFPMLQYAKQRRPQIPELDKAFEPIRKRVFA